MPKPVKKKAPKKPSSDPNRRAGQLMAEQLDKLSQGKWANEPPAPENKPQGDPFEAQFRARMAELGRKGGKIGGKRRMQTLTQERRTAIALKAARSRWGKRKKKSDGA